MQSKFAGLLDDRIKATPKGNGGLRGKRSMAEYKQRSVLLRIDSWKKANRKLEDTEDGRDFSDLMQDLLDAWLQKDGIA